MSSRSPVGRLNQFLKRFASGVGRRRRPRAELTQEAAEASAAALYMLMFGRAPDSGVDLAARAAMAWSEALGEMMASEAFQEKTLDALAAGRPFPQLRLGVAPPPDLLRDAAALAEPAREKARGRNGRSSPSASEADWAARIAGPFDDWPAFFAALLSDRPPAPHEGPWRAALSVLPVDAREAFSDRVARARMGALSPPNGAYVLAAELAGPRRVTGAARLLGATPRRATLQVRDGWSREARASARLMAESGAPIDFTLTLDAPYDPAAGPLLLEVAERAGAVALGPPLRLEATLPEAAMRRRLSAAAAAARNGDVAELDRRIDALRRTAPFSPESWSVAVEVAMWRGDRAGAERLVEALKETANAISGANAKTLRAAAGRLAERLEASARATVATAAERLKEPETSPTIGLEMARRFAAPSAIAAWLSGLPTPTRRRALALIAEKGAFPAHRTLLAHLSPEIAPEASPWEALAAARLAQADERVETAIAWVRAALKRTPPSVHTAASDIGAAIAAFCEGVDAPAAADIASDLLAELDQNALSSASEGLSTDDALRLARLERRLCDHDPLRAPDRLKMAASAAKRAGLRALAIDPTDLSARLVTAGALSTMGQDAAASATLRGMSGPEGAPDATAAEGGEATPDRLAADLLAVEERAGHASAVIELTASVVSPALPPDDPIDAAAAAYRLRALRTLERLDEALSLASRCVGSSDPSTRREAILTVFFGGDFARAEALAEVMLSERPRDKRMRLIAAAAAIERGESARAEAMLDIFERHHGPVAGAALADPLALEARLMRCAVDRSFGREDGCVDHLNRIFDALGAQRLRRRGSASFGPDGLEPTDAERSDRAAHIGPAPRLDGPLVSVVMTAYNAAGTIETAARSILAQNYRDLELIIVDDGSLDSTPEKLRALAAEDDRVRLLRKTINEGVYVAKNQGLLEARGVYAAFQDADDWSHPDRIGKTVAALEAAPWLIGAASDWMRMTTDGRLIIRATAEIAQPSPVSLMIRREPALRRVGFFDSVRIGADLEFSQRLDAVFGPGSVARLRWPLMIGRAHPQALSADPTSGLTRTGSSPPRRVYQSAATEWRRRIQASQCSGFMPFPQTTRPFPAPATILP